MATKKQKTVTTTPKKPWWNLAIKFVVVVLVATAVVVFTDVKGYFEPDQKNNHTLKKWDAFYDFTKTDTIDVLLIGNSHCYAGVNPKNLSAALGANCFILASPGTSIMDSYYCLKEGLKKTTPKVVIIETYGISNTENHLLSGQALSDQFKSFESRKAVGLKLGSMPRLFSGENYIPAWSKTIRNHDFLFHDQKQLQTNLQLMKQHKKKKKELYLGRFVSFTTGMADTTLAKYDTQGPTVDGDLFEVNKENTRYTNKIIKLCRKKGITPVFVTIPMYYKHIQHYDTWKERLSAVIEPTGAAWLDLQQPYDTLLFDPDCFENTVKNNQHTTYVGSLRCTYKIAHFLVDSLHINLPKRDQTTHWHDMFYGQEGYFENYPSRKADEKNVLLGKNLRYNGLTILDGIQKKGDKHSTLLMKVQKEPGVTPPKTLHVYALVSINGEVITTRFDLQRLIDYDPLRHDVYGIFLLPDAQVLEISMENPVR